MTTSFQQNEALQRLRRLRRTPALRALRQETRLSPDNLVQPLFVVEQASDAGPIVSLPGVQRITLEKLPDRLDAIVESGVRSVLLFGVPIHKDATGDSASAPDGIVPSAVGVIKAHAPQLAIITDVCLCQYTTHGHCGLIGDSGVLNDPTLEVIARIAVTHAAAGADLVAPSGMMDGSVASIRQQLDCAGHHDVGVLSYSVKYASALYGPFRDAVHSSQRVIDRRTHQMDPANASEALAEARQDIAEGADMLMVKPAGSYLDIVASLHAHFPETPLAAYQVSGEYAMIVSAAQRGWLDERAALMESLMCIRRAGASVIITYAAERVARWLREQNGEGH